MDMQTAPPAGICAVTATMPNTESGTVAAHTLEALCRATPARFAAPVLTIAASHAWWRGDGTKAGMCIDVALEIEPDHKLARLMRLSLDHGLRMPAA